MLGYSKNIITFPKDKKEEAVFQPLVENKIETQNFRWTKKYDDRLTELWLNKKSSNYISQEMKLSRNSIMSRVRRLGLLGKGGTRSFKKKEYIYVSFQEAPIQAFKQALLPKLISEAEILAGDDEAMKKSIVILCLIFCRDYAEHKFLSAVTEWEWNDIALRLRRGAKAKFILDNGKPNHDIMKLAFGENIEGEDIPLVLLAGVINGSFIRSEDDRYSIGDILDAP